MGARHLINLVDQQKFSFVDGIYLENELNEKLSGYYENKQKEIYDARSTEYQAQNKKDYPTNLGYNHLLLTYREHVRCIKKLAIKPGDKVLDIGCSTGQLLHFMNHQAEIEGIGVDISIEALKTARLNSSKKFDFVLCSIEKGLPFEDNSIDVITCMDVIEHLENPSFVLSEMCRVLKPGGRFLFHLPTSDIFLSLDWCFQKFTPEAFNKNMQAVGHFLEVMKSSKQMKEIIVKSGLSVSEHRKFNAFFQTFFDYCITHRILNRLFFVWGVPIKYYHLGVAPLLEVFILWPDRILQKFGIGASSYYLGKK